MKNLSGILFKEDSDYVPLTLDEWIELDAKRREQMNASISTHLVSSRK